MNKGGDFLTMLLEDELFQDKEELIVDECLTFMLAASQTTTGTIIHCLHFLSRHGNVREKLRAEMRKLMGSSDENLQDISQERWKEILLDKELASECNYLSYCVSETLRLDPPIRSSSKLITTQEIELSTGTRILEGQAITLNIAYLQTNPKHWIQAEDYIPERFDPTSEYYLRPDGKKRHPMSFGPFLGGRRICLGKTFAESIVKCKMAMLVALLDFTFVKEEVKNDKRPYTMFHSCP